MISVKKSLLSRLSKSKTMKTGRESKNISHEPDEDNNKDGKEEHEDNLVGDVPHQTSSVSVTSNTTNQTSSSRKSRRASLRRDKLAPSLFRSYDPMQVISQEQLDAFKLLVSTPIWIFDFIERKNRYANPAGLDLWGALSLDEFMNRSMTDMSAASVARTQECQNRVEKAQVVQDMWTFYPKGKARTVQITMTSVRLSPEEDHCSILIVANMITPSSSMGTNNFNSRSSFCSTSTNNTNNTGGNSSNTTATATELVTTTMASNTIKEISERNESESKKKSTNFTPAEKNNESVRNNDNVEFLEGDKEELKRGTEGGEKEEKDEDDTNWYVEETIPLNHILEGSSNHTAHHQSMTPLDGNNPLNQEILRGVEIIRHLPIAVCQFDMKGRVMFQNPAAYLPPLDDEEEKESDDDESLMDEMDTDEESEYYDQLFEQQYGIVQTTSSNNGRGNFLDRFVNKKVARELLKNLQDEPKEKRSNSITSTSSSVVAACNNLANTTTVTIEAELHTSTKGRTRWSAIQLRKTKDPVTSRPVILYSAQDKSDAMEAKREREARLQKSEFLAIMAHEIRTPLHQVTGFIDLLELDACNTPITTISSSGAINSTQKSKSFVETDTSIKNALFPNLERANANSMDTLNIVKKSRSTSLINTRSPRWPSVALPRQSIGNLTGEQKGYIKLLKSSANQLMTVISDVLDYSKLEAGKMKTERIPFELLSVVQGSMEAVRGSCEEKGLSLTLEYGGSDDDEYDFDDDEGDYEDSGVNGNKNRRKTIRRRRSFDGKTGDLRLPRRRKIGRTHSFNNKNKKKRDNYPDIKSNDIPFRILGDPNRLRQVLLNLLSNAVKFTEKGGIHVRVSSFTRKNIPPDTIASINDDKSNHGSAKAIRRFSTSSSSSLSEKNEEKRRITRRSSMSSTTSTSEKREEGRKARRRSSLSTSTTPLERKEEGKVPAMRDTVDETRSRSSNSLSNSKASKENASRRSLRIVVTDTGMGISKENQNTIFEKYQQANLSVARNFGGTGLGLSICKLLVQETMGGSIGVDSDEGSGSSFYITLPIEVPSEISDDTSRGVNGGQENQKNGESMNVLVAEDNKINQKLVANMLKRMGHKSTLVENGRQAVDMIVKHSQQDESSISFDAVLMDIQMPVMDGLEATRRLRTMGYTDLPILGLTASVKRSDYEELGFTDWLPKPILMKDLKAKLLKLCLHNSEDSEELTK